MSEDFDEYRFPFPDQRYQFADIFQAKIPRLHNIQHFHIAKESILLFSVQLLLDFETENQLK